MQLPLGDWDANIDGFAAQLKIGSIDQEGFVSGRLSGYAVHPGGAFANGLWDGTAQRLILRVAPPAPAAVAPEIFEAYLFATPHDPAPGQDIVWTLAGSVQSTETESLKGHHSNVRRTRFGWFAQKKEVA